MASPRWIQNLFFILGIFASGAKSVPAMASDVELLINCGSNFYLDINSNSLVLAKFDQKIAESKFQFVADGSLSYEASVNDQSSSGETSGFNLKLSKPLWNPAASEFIGASAMRAQSVELGLRADLMDHLLSVNSKLLGLRLILIEKSVIAAQVRELEDLDRFAGRLMRSRVIDPADALLVKENLIRFQLRQLEVDEEQNSSLAGLAIASGIRREKFKTDDLLDGGLNQVKVEAEFNLARKRLRELSTKIQSLPRSQAASVSQAALQKEYTSVERTWYPKLFAEGGIRQNFAPVASVGNPLEGFLGLALRFDLPAQFVSADLERIQALRQIEAEREKRSVFEYKNLLTSKYEQMGILFNQFKKAMLRKENLERLLDLQLVKFKSGKLSFLNVNDVMLSLLEARRQTGSSRARIISLDNDVAIILAGLEQRTISRQKCE